MDVFDLMTIIHRSLRCLVIIVHARLFVLLVRTYLRMSLETRTFRGQRCHFWPPPRSWCLHYVYNFPDIKSQVEVHDVAVLYMCLQAQRAYMEEFNSGIHSTSFPRMSNYQKKRKIQLSQKQEKSRTGKTIRGIIFQNPQRFAIKIRFTQHPFSHPNTSSDDHIQVVRCCNGPVQFNPRNPNAHNPNTRRYGTHSSPKHRHSHRGKFRSTFALGESGPSYAPGIGTAS